MGISWFPASALKTSSTLPAPAIASPGASWGIWPGRASIRREGRIPHRDLRRAVIYGSVMGSFCCVRNSAWTGSRTLTRRRSGREVSGIQGLHGFLESRGKTHRPVVGLGGTTLAVANAMAAHSAAANRFVSIRRYKQYYGDAQSHINIARRIIDSRTPGVDQLGTPWLPLPHLLMLPWVGNDYLWQTGLAGAIPSGICFVLAATFLYAAAKSAFCEPGARSCGGGAVGAEAESAVSALDADDGAGLFGTCLMALLYPSTVRFEADAVDVACRWRRVWRRWRQRSRGMKAGFRSRSSACISWWPPRKSR